ncbi:MAG TPA: hypothetical protein VFG10_01250 [Saprospiraceae bacterium]|nr:hypothetical protein [Saprospiraceae bacterium]
MDRFFASIFCVCIINILFAQSTLKKDTGQIEAHYDPVVIADMKSAWLTKSIISHDSIINFIASQADIELKNNSDIRYIYNLIQSILTLNVDTAFIVILNNITIDKYINYSKPINVYTKTPSYPVIDALYRAPFRQIQNLKEYLITSDYLSKQINNEEIMLFWRLLVNHDPTFGGSIKSYHYKGQIQKNIQFILEFSQN